MHEDVVGHAAHAQAARPSRLPSTIRSASQLTAASTMWWAGVPCRNRAAGTGSAPRSWAEPVLSARWSAGSPVCADLGATAGQVTQTSAPARGSEHGPHGRIGIGPRGQQHSGHDGTLLRSAPAPVAGLLRLRVCPRRPRARWAVTRPAWFTQSELLLEKGQTHACLRLYDGCGFVRPWDRPSGSR